MKIENGEILISGLRLSQGLNTLIAETRVQLFFIHTEAGSKAYQSGAQKTAEQDDCQDLDREFCQTGQGAACLPLA